MHRKTHVGIQATSRLFTFAFFTPLSVTKTNSTEKKKKTPQFLSSNHTIPTLCFRRTPQRSRTRRYLHRFSSALQQRVARQDGRENRPQQEGGTRSLEVKSAPRGKKQ
ncbi:unnamed protein product, partial [Ixodes pacificus]